MALRPEELDRIKWELGVSPIRLGAEPYITYVAIFDRVVQPYLFDNSTTSTTSVTAGQTIAITLAANPVPPNGVGLTFNVGTSCIVDQGPAQETVVIQALSGLSATCTFANAHSGTYSVYPNGSEQIVRDIITRLDNIKAQLTTIAPQTSGIEAVDEVKLYSAGTGKRGRTMSKFQELVHQREQARDDLGEAIGFANLRRLRRGGFGLEVY